MSKHLDQVKTLLDKKTPVKTIAEKLGLSCQHVYRIINDNDLPKPGYSPTEDRRPEVMVLFEEGYSVTEIAKTLNLKNSQVLYTIWKSGKTVSERGRNLVYTGKVPTDTKWTIGPRVWPSSTKAGHYATTAGEAIKPKQGLWHICTCQCGAKRVLQLHSVLSGTSKQCRSCAAAQRFGQARKQA